MLSGLSGLSGLSAVAGGSSSSGLIADGDSNSRRSAITYRAGGLMLYCPIPDNDLTTQEDRQHLIRRSYRDALITGTPVSFADSYSTDEDVELVVAAPGVLSNDTDPTSLSLTADLVTNVSNGLLVLNPNGSFSYTPNPNYNGSDSFTYRAYNGVFYATPVTVTITINAVNDAPVADNDSYSTNEDTTLNVAAPGVLTGDTDTENDSLTAELVSDVSNGTLTLNSNGSFDYTPDSNFVGSDSFTYRAYDGVAYSNVATVTITVNPVNDAPVANNDAYSVDEDTLLTVAAPGVLGNDTDIENDSLTAILVSDVSNGTLTLNSDGSFTYMPDSNFNGSDSFTYKANDGTADSNNATVTITVNAVNDAPVSVTDSYSMVKNTTLTTAAPGVLTNDTDVENDSLTAILVSDVSNGSLTLNSDGSFSYTPTTDYVGADSFTYKSNDGTADGNTVTVSITVNDAVFETITGLSALQVGNIVTVDWDDVVDSEEYEVQVNEDSAGWATLVTGLTASWCAHNIYAPTSSSLSAMNSIGFMTNGLRFIPPVPDGDITSAADSGHVIRRGTRLTPVFETIVNLSATTSGNDIQVDWDDVTGAIGYEVQHSTDDATWETVGFPAVSEYLYENRFTVHASMLTYRAGGIKLFPPKPDSDLTSQGDRQHLIRRSYRDALITTTAQAAPVAVNDSYSVDEDTLLTVAAPGVLGNDTDINQDALVAELITTTSNGTLELNSNGAFTYEPDSEYSGEDSFVYRVSDGTANSGNATVTITINQINDAPYTLPDSYNVAGNDTLTVNSPGVLANDIDVENDTITAILVSDVSNGTLTLNSNGSFTYVPTESFTGIDTFTYKTNDGTSDGNTASVTINVYSSTEIARSSISFMTTGFRYLTPTPDGTITGQEDRQHIVRRSYRKNLVTIQYPLAAGLLSWSDLTYSGSFKVAEGAGGYSVDAIGSSAGINLSSNTMYFTTHPWYDGYQEYTIPNSLGDAASIGDLNNLPGATGIAGRRIDLSTDVSGGTTADRVGDILVYDNKLYSQAYIFYDASLLSTDNYLIWDSTNIETANVSGGNRLGSLNPAYYAGFFMEIPASKQAKLGGYTHAAGTFSGPIVGRSSQGPNFGAFNAADLSASSTPTAADYLYYPLGDNLEDPKWDYVSSIAGGFIPTGTNCVLFFGRKAIAGTTVGYGEASAFNDVCGGGKGYHAQDGAYTFCMWGYNLDDLEDVRLGNVAPSDVIPYAYTEFSFPGTSACHGFTGVQYDPVNKKVYFVIYEGVVVNAYAKGPLVHVYTHS